MHGMIPIDMKKKDIENKQPIRKRKNSLAKKPKSETKPNSMKQKESPKKSNSKEKRHPHTAGLVLIVIVFIIVAIAAIVVGILMSPKTNVDNGLTPERKQIILDRLHQVDNTDAVAPERRLEALEGLYSARQ